MLTIISYFTYINIIIAFLKAPKFFEILPVTYVYLFSAIVIVKQQLQQIIRLIINMVVEFVVKLFAQQLTTKCNKLKG